MLLKIADLQNVWRTKYIKDKIFAGNPQELQNRQKFSPSKYFGYTVLDNLCNKDTSL